MNQKEELKRQLEEIKELTDYISGDTEAASRLAKIRRRVEMALNALERI
jgi:predicted site-specific integrase-resolvase